MSWDYSDLSHKAKQAGGPEKFVSDLEKYNYSKGKKDGKLEQVLVDLSVLAVGFGVCKLVKFVRNCIKKTKESEITDAQAEKARSELIKDIKEKGVSDETVDETVENFVESVEVDRNGETS